MTLTAADEVLEDSSPQVDASPSDSQQQQQQQKPPPLITAFEKDAGVKGLRPGLRDRLRLRVQAAIQSEMVAHALTLFRYARLQQQLMAAKGWGRNRAAQQLNKWIASEQPLCPLFCFFLNTL